MRSLKIFFLLMLLTLTVLHSASVGIYAMPPSPEPDGPPTSDLIIVRLYYQNRTHLDAVAGELDIWEVHADQGYVIAMIDQQQYKWLQTLGYRIEIDQAKTEKLLAPAAPLDPRFYYYDSNYPNANGRYITQFLQNTQAAYPHLTELFDAGDAWQGLNGGYHRDIWVLRITNENARYGFIADKPAFFLFAGIHAREVALPELAIRYIQYLTGGYNGQGGYGLDPDVTWLVNHNVVYVLVLQNPDGHRVNEENTGANRRKNMDSDDGCSTSSLWGVDLNRNHSFFWNCCGGSSGSACDETYRGPSRASEPETQAFQNFFGTVMHDQNGANSDDTFPPAAPLTTTGTFLSLHSYADEILWPWDLTQPAPNAAQLQAIGRKLGVLSGLAPTNDIGYAVDGPTDDWTYGKFGIPSFTFEVGPDYGSCAGFFPAYGCIDGIDGMPRNFWAEIRPAFLYLHKIARTPYITAYGPDARSLLATPNTVPQTTPIQLTATIADQRYGSDPLRPVMAAEYFVDAPGQDGTGTPMQPADGSWGSTTENVVATLNTGSLSVGQHYVLVHGRNDQGQWGPFTAVFVTVNAAPDSHISGLVYDGETTQPIAQAQVNLSNAAHHLSAVTASDGHFQVNVFSGVYTLSVQALGYYPATLADVTASPGLTTSVSISLTTLPTGTLSGYVTEAGSGIPLSATVTAQSSYTTYQTTTDPTSGFYQLDVYSNTYTLTAQAARYAPTQVAGLPISNGAQVGQNLSLSPLPCVLLVDDDGGQAYESYFQAALEQTGILYQTWQVSSQSNPTAQTMAAYPVVLWFTGNDSSPNPLTTQDRANLTTYLNGGGALFLTGEGIGVLNQNTAFYTRTLSTQFRSDDSKSKLLTGGGPFAGLSLSISDGDGANNQFWPDAIGPRLTATQVFTYANGLGGGVAYDAGVYRAINLGFGIEGISTAADRAAVLQQGLTWLGCAPHTRRFILKPSVSSDAVLAGGRLTYTLALTNHSLVPATNVIVTSTLPLHTAFAGASPQGVSANGLVTWTVPSLQPIEHISLTLAATVDIALAGTPIVLADYGLRADPPVWVQVGGPVTATISGVPLTAVSFQVAPPQPIAGQPVTFTASYTPLIATLPVSITWSLGGTGLTTTHTFSTVDVYTVTVMAANPYGQTIWSQAIETLPQPTAEWYIYLPIVIRPQP